MNEEIRLSNKENSPIAARPSALEIIARVSAIIPVLTLVSLGFSVILDVGYFEALGLSLQDVPTTLSDHARTAVVWSPALVFGLIYVFAIELRQLGSGEDEAGPRESSGVDVSKGESWWPLIGSAMLFLIGIGATIVFGERVIAILSISVIPLLWRVLCWFVPAKGKNLEKIRVYRLLLFTSGLVVAMFFIVGFAMGRKALRSSEQPIASVQLVESSTDLVDVRVLRWFEDVGLVADSNLRIWVVPRSSLSSVREMRPFLPVSRGYMCDIWGIFCPHDWIAPTRVNTSGAKN